MVFKMQKLIYHGSRREKDLKPHRKLLAVPGSWWGTEGDQNGDDWQESFNGETGLLLSYFDVFIGRTRDWYCQLHLYSCNKHPVFIFWSGMREDIKGKVSKAIEQASKH